MIFCGNLNICSVAKDVSRLHVTHRVNLIVLFSTIANNKFTAWRGDRIIPKHRLELNKFVWFYRSLAKKFQKMIVKNSETRLKPRWLAVYYYIFNFLILIEFVFVSIPHSPQKNGRIFNVIFLAKFQTFSKKWLESQNP
jgi:hypothetical protein